MAVGALPRTPIDDITDRGDNKPISNEHDNDPLRLGRILMIVATLEGSGSCDGREGSAGTGAANGQA
jgi:hypothetical protein